MLIKMLISSSLQLCPFSSNESAKGINVPLQTRSGGVEKINSVIFRCITREFISPKDLYVGAWYTPPTFGLFSLRDIGPLGKAACSHKCI